MPHRDIVFTQYGYYHLYNRGARRQNIFRERDNYLFVLQQMRRYSRELHVSIIAYCLMPNHYHVLARQDGDAPAGLLPQRVFNSYTKAYNKRYNLSGTLFEGRFQALAVTTDVHLAHLCRYIHANPVKHGFTKHPDDWEFTNYAEWVGTRAGTLVDHLFVADHFPTVDAYRAFLDEYYAGYASQVEGFQRCLLEDED
jgi:REP element-mobilizing transposase RayT